jgi:hypothetical protein
VSTDPRNADAILVLVSPYLADFRPNAVTTVVNHPAETDINKEV